MAEPRPQSDHRYNQVNCGCGETGRRARFRFWFSKGSEGSSPFIRTSRLSWNRLIGFWGGGGGGAGLGGGGTAPFLSAAHSCVTASRDRGGLIKPVTETI